MTTKTDADGKFLLRDLSVGVYTLNYLANAYKPFALTDIEVRAHEALTAAAQLVPDISAQ